MSDFAPGPGWWMASDGRWYPPELHPAWAPLHPWPPVADPTGTSGSRRRTTWIVTGVVLVAVAVAVAATVVSTSPTGSSSAPGPGHSPVPFTVAPLTGFAGYHWAGTVHQISARWRVPVIEDRSSVGHASTWIGAQNDGGGYPFIQLGVTEDNFGSGPSYYEGFWSDTTASFHPQPLGIVGPGDLISASMVQTSGGWSLTFDDAAAATSVTKLIAYGVGATFSAGEWVQEDPAAGPVVAVDLPYPRTSTVRFDRLLVDGRAPRLTLEDGQTLSAADGIRLVPTAVHHDSFALSPPTGVAARYMADAAQLDAALSRFATQYPSWSSTSSAAKTTDVADLSRAYSVNAAELTAQSWPAAAQPDMALLAQELRRVVVALAAWTASGLEPSGTAYATLLADQEIGPVADKARAALGLPPP